MYTEKSAANIAEWSREETGEFASKEEAETTGGGGGGRKGADANGRGTRGKRCGKRSRGCSSRWRRHVRREFRGRGRSGSGGASWGGKRKRERVSSLRENSSGDSFRVGEGEGGGEASEVTENSKGDCQVVGGVVKSPRGTNTPGVEELLRGDETSRVTLEGDGVPGTDRRGQGGYGNSPPTWDTKGSTGISCKEETDKEQEPAAPSITL